MSFFICLNDLDMSACNFLAVRDIDFADLYRGLTILNEDHSVIRNCS